MKGFAVILGTHVLRECTIFSNYILIGQNLATYHYPRGSILPRINTHSLPLTGKENWLMYRIDTILHLPYVVARSIKLP